LLLLIGLAQAQEKPTATPADAASSNEPEMSSRDTTTTFKVNVKLVLVKVVVRDAKGNAVGNLQKEDFLLFDKGKPQVVTFFSVDTPGSVVAREENQQPSIEAAAGEAAPPSLPEHYIAYVFDDIHVEFGDLARSRDAASRHFATLASTDRAAVYTTSGEVIVDFTSDHAKLQDALLKVRPHPIARRGNNDCPDISYYQADLIVNKNDPDATKTAIQERLECSPQSPTSSINVFDAQGNSAGFVAAAARGVLSAGRQESDISLRSLKDAVRTVSHLPGQRSIILVSPGFIIPELEYEFTDIVDLALRSQVIISALDARGLYNVMPYGDASSHAKIPEGNGDDIPVQSGATPSPDRGAPSLVDGKALIKIAAASADADLMAALADGTGGTFFHNNNDFDEGFRRIAQTPAFSYTLGFTPQNLKPDGSFHSLSVKLKKPDKVTVQARRGYFAPKHLQDPAEQAKEDIQEAIFSQEQLHDLPLDLHTQFFKSSDDAARLTVLAHLDANHLRFTKADGRNNQELTVVSALFNSNGNFLEGTQKVVTLHLKDETLQNRLGNGITMKANFDVKPGSYLVRVVVRDSQGELSAQNGAVQIP